MGHHHHEGESHDHGHEGHNHGAIVALTHVNTAFVIGIILNLAYVIVQIIIGLHIHSLSLLSDAGHNFLDVGALALSLLAFKLNKAKATENYTYGYRKSSILISFFNAIVLLISIGAIGYESIYRFHHPQPLPGFTISIVAAIGIVVNGVSAFMFFKNKEKDMNVKAAFLHLLADALVSIIIHFTNLFWIDPVLSLIVCAVIIASTWNLLKGSLRLSLDGVPANIDLNKIKDAALQINGILDIHHIHVWAISTTDNALTAHLKVSGNATMQQIQLIKKRFKHELEHQNINHATLEVEADDTDCEAVDC
jgi:cobalt-zinc-cadmium efflux system protein